MVDTLDVVVPPMGSVVIYAWHFKGERFEAPALVSAVPKNGRGEPQANAALNLWVIADPEVAAKGGMVQPVVHRVNVPHILHAKSDDPYWHQTD